MKIKTLLLTAIAAAAFSVTCLAQGITVTLNGNTISFPNQQPTVVEGRTLIPLRGVFDNMGYSIDWNGTTKTVTLTKNGDEIVINIGENCYYLNGVSNTIDVPAQIINGSTMLPLRAIADASGCQVLWDGDTKTATIVYIEGYADVVTEGTIIADTQSEADYAKSYSAISEEFNTATVDFMNLCEEISQNGVESTEQLQQIGTYAQNMSDAANTAVTKLNALSCPSKYTSLNTATVEYMQAAVQLADLYVDYINGDMEYDEFSDAVNTVGTEAMAKEAAYISEIQKVLGE